VTVAHPQQTQKSGISTWKVSKSDSNKKGGVSVWGVKARFGADASNGFWLG